jgi:hypothetical protein
MISQIFSTKKWQEKIGNFVTVTYIATSEAKKLNTILKKMGTFLVENCQVTKNSDM